MNITYIDEKGYKRYKNGHRLVSRKIAQEKIYERNRNKYSLPFREYIVHHKNENKLDNKIQNLELYTKEQHNKVHNRFGSMPKRDHRDYNSREKQGYIWEMKNKPVKQTKIKKSKYKKTKLIKKGKEIVKKVKETSLIKKIVIITITAIIIYLWIKFFIGLP